MIATKSWKTPPEEGLCRRDAVGSSSKLKLWPLGGQRRAEDKNELGEMAIVYKNLQDKLVIIFTCIKSYKTLV